MCHVGEASSDVTPKRVMADLREAGPQSPHKTRPWEPCAVPSDWVANFTCN